MKRDSHNGGRRSRPLLLLERTMYRDGRTPFTSVFTIQISGELDEGRLRQALACAQAAHPLLRCVVEEAPGGPRFVLLGSPAPIPLRIVERFGEDHWQAEARREWVTPFEASREPLVRLVWLRAGDVHELMLVGHHCICDGYSGIGLVRDFLEAYDNPERDPAACDALGAIEDIVPAVQLESPSFQRRVRWKERILRLTLFLKCLGSKSPGAPIAAEEMYFHRWNIGEVATLTLTECCRSERVTVLTAVSLAFMQAFRDVRGAQGLARTCAMVNARRFLPEMHADAMFGLAPAVALRTKGLLPAPQDISAATFWARARAVKKDLTRQIDRLGAGLHTNLVAFERLHDKYASLVAFFESTPKVRNVTLSNLGRVALPQQYRSLRLERVYSPLVMVSPTPANTVVVSSFAGQMEFAIVSDGHSLPFAQALEIQRRAMEILRICVALPTQYKSPVDSEQSANAAINIMKSPT